MNASARCGCGSPRQASPSASRGSLSTRLAPSPPQADYRDNAGKEPHEVARKKPNAWGLYDMYGLAHEWSADYYAADY